MFELTADERRDERASECSWVLMACVGLGVMLAGACVMCAGVCVLLLG